MIKIQKQLEPLISSKGHKYYLKHTTKIWGYYFCIYQRIQKLQMFKTKYLVDTIIGAVPLYGFRMFGLDDNQGLVSLLVLDWETGRVVVRAFKKDQVEETPFILDYLCDLENFIQKGGKAN